MKRKGQSIGKRSRKRQADKHSRLIDQRLNERKAKMRKFNSREFFRFFYGTATLDKVEELQETFDLLQNKNADSSFFVGSANLRKEIVYYD